MMNKDKAITIKALQYAASLGHGSFLREMQIAPVIYQEKAQPEQAPVATPSTSQPKQVLEKFDELPALNTRYELDALKYLLREVSANFTPEDDLPNGLLQRINAANQRR